MKYIVVLGDGMSDLPVTGLDNKTPLQVARKPNIDFLAQNGVIGLVKTIPASLAPGSDVANLSVLGYDPEKYYTGRSPLEAASMGVALNDADVTFRTNFVTLSNDDIYEKKVMVDYSAGEISSEESKILINELNKHFKNDILEFYPGISYRHCLLWKNGPIDFNLTPPHDISDKIISDYLPKGKNSATLLNMMKESTNFLSKHPVNKDRVKKGLNPANAIWIWGEGKKTVLPSFSQKYGLNASVISAVDLVKGIGISAKMDSIDVEGATGNIDTNYEGKAKAALAELKKGKDFVYVHIEAPDECGHQGDVTSKVKAIELIDEKIVGLLLERLDIYDDYKILVMPDHPTPLALKTHTSDPVPFVIYQKSAAKSSGANGYDESQAKQSGIFFDKGEKLMNYFISNN